MKLVKTYERIGGTACRGHFITPGFDLWFGFSNLNRDKLKILNKVEVGVQGIVVLNLDVNLDLALLWKGVPI